MLTKAVDEANENVVISDDTLAQLNLLKQITTSYDLQEEKTKVKDRISDTELPLMVIIAGEGSFGKSSLINGLLGKTVTPVSILPLTWKVDLYWRLDDGEEYAEIRFRGKADRQRVSIEEAQKLCAEEESALRKHKQKQTEILEVIWRYRDIRMEKNLSLIDTPGISADGLGVEVSVERLVKGLGAVYSVKDIWEYYYHRADVVIWAFAADKLKSSATYHTIEQLVQNQHKLIIPVVTKADQIPPDRWQEIHDCFKEYYADRFECLRETQLFITGCPARKPALGLDELREYVENELAPNAQAQKITASRDFIYDCARHVEKILDESGKQLIMNLRTIADTADEVALLLMRTSDNMTRQYIYEYNAQVSKLEGSLDTFLRPLVQSLLTDKKETSESIQTKLTNYYRLYNIESEMHGRLVKLGNSLSNQALPICKARPLYRIKIATSGRFSRDSFTFLLKITEPHIGAISFTGITFYPPPLGSLDNVIRTVKIFFGSFKFTEEEEIWLSENKQKITQNLQLIKSSIESYFKQYRLDLARALSQAVQSSFQEVTQCDHQELLELLAHLDQDILKLHELNKNELKTATYYEEWARYWVSETRDIQTVRKLIVGLMEQCIPDMRAYIINIPYPNELPKWKKCALKAFNQNRCTEEKSEGALPEFTKPELITKKEKFRWFCRWLTYLFGPHICENGSYLVKLSLNTYYRFLEEQFAVKAYEFFAEHVKEWAYNDPSLLKMQENMSQQIPDTTFEGLKDAYAQLVLDVCFRVAHSVASHHELQLTLPTHGATGLLGKIRLIGSGRRRRLKMRKEIIRNMPGQLTNFFRITLMTSAHRIDGTLFDELTRRMVVKLNPRPLQRALNGELHVS